MKFLVDANVLSEMAKPAPSPSVVGWFQLNNLDSVVNPIILGEIEYGILSRASGRRKKQLLEWFEDGVRTLPVVPIDAVTSSLWAKLLSELRRKGQSISINDSLIAATSKQHQLIIVTRNVAHYRHAGVRIVNPFDTE